MSPAASEANTSVRFTSRSEAKPTEARFRMIYFEIPETQEDLDLAAEFARRAGELPNLELLGRQPRGRTLAEIERATALVSTSRAEGMPNVFLEAWARGVPVLTLEYDPDGLIADRALGIAAQGSADALAEGARRLWGDPSRRDELGRNGRAFVQQRHSPDAVGARWAQALRGLIGGAASTDAPAHRD